MLPPYNLWRYLKRYAEPAEHPDKIVATAHVSRLKLLFIAATIVSHGNRGWVKYSRHLRVRTIPQGQITIPLETRKKYGLLPDTEVEFVPGKDAVLLCKATAVRHRGSKLVAQMRGGATIKISGTTG